MSESPTAGPGWYGKIACLGDFAARRLPHAFTSLWDAWLARVLEGSRASLSDGWHDAYSHAPLWSFVCGAGVCGASPWTGVLVPSLDRVGRCYPLTICAPLGVLPGREEEVRRLHDWFLTVGRAGFATWDEARPLEAFEADLAAIGAPPEFPRTPCDDWAARLASWLGDERSGREPANGAEGMAAVAAAIAAAALEGRSLWMETTDAGTRPSVFVEVGLPGPERFAVMLKPR